MFKRTSFLLLSEIAAKGLAFLLVPLYSHLIAPSDFGVISILQILFTFFFLLFSFSLKNTFDKYFFDSEKGGPPALVTNILAIQLLVFLVAIPLYLLIKSPVMELFDLSDGFYVSIVILTCISASFYPLYNSFLLCSGKVKQVGLYAIIASIARSVTALVLVLVMEDKILAIILANLVEHTSLLFISIPFFIKRIKPNTIRGAYIRDLFSYSLLYFPTTFSNFFIKFSDRLMIQWILGYEALGIYSMATRLVNIPGQIISTVNKNFMPQIYEAISKENKTSFNQMTLYFLVFLFLLIFGLVLFTPELFSLIGKNYAAALPIFIVLLLSSYANGYNLIIQPALMYFKKYVKVKSIIWVAVGLLNIGLNLLLIPKYGNLGAAIATTISFVIAIPVSGYFAKKAFKGDYHLNWYGLSFLLFLGIGAAVFFLPSMGWMGIVPKLFVYMLFSYIFISRVLEVSKYFEIVVKKLGKRF